MSDNDLDKRIIELKKYLSKKELEFVENRYKGSNISIKENLEDLILLFENGNTEEGLSIQKKIRKEHLEILKEYLSIVIEQEQ
ncbi:hypothetical protein [Vagococcus fluvialis]|uniref:hypothetical protein n=1 Tax=Vagococcus fluvialis TaxID=2738 RepID=UPI003D121E23